MRAILQKRQRIQQPQIAVTRIGGGVRHLKYIILTKQREIHLANRLLRVQFDDQLLVDLLWDLIPLWVFNEDTLHLIWVEFQPGKFANIGLCTDAITMTAGLVISHVRQ
jgi:hypothetical protein